MKYVALVLWSLALLFGGGTQVGLPGDLLLEIVSIPIIVHCILVMTSTGVARADRVPLGIIAATLAVMLLQLVPLPPGLWSELSVQRPVTEVYDAAGLSPGWRPLSLAPHATIYAIAALLPPLAMFLALGRVSASDCRMIVLAVVIVAAATVAIAMRQVSTDDVFHATLANANFGVAVGLFSNKNHFTALIYCTMPLTVAWLLESRHASSANPVVILAGGLILLLFQLVGLNLSNSRAGVMLGAVALILSAAMALLELNAGFLRSRISIVAIGGLAAVGLLVIGGSVLLVTDRGVTDSARQAMRATSIAIIEEQKGLGSGFGTFVPVYMLHEDVAAIGPTFVNHAHNDWLELILEGSVLVIVVEIAFLVWWGRLAWRIWSSRQNGRFSSFGKAASISTLLLMVHSLLDYPLRTSALLVTFAACCALMLRIDATLSYRPQRRALQRQSARST